jgi:ankyrin repeat protein
LHYACLGNNLELVDILINYGADVNAEDLYYSTPLSIAAYGERLDYVDRLLKEDHIDVDALSGSSLGGPLETAIMSGYGDMVRVLVESNVAISRYMVSHAACRYKFRDSKVERESIDRRREKGTGTTGEQMARS